MGKADVNVNIWLSEKKRFANLFNGVIYGGRQVILPEDLEEVNPVSSVSVKNRTGKTKNMKKYRDIIMKWRNQATLVLLANESQDKVHYAMPHKVCFMMEWITKHRFGIIGKTLMTDESRIKKQVSR